MDEENFKCKGCGFEYGDRTFVGDSRNWFWTCKWCLQEQPVDWREIEKLIKEDNEEN